MKKKPKKANLGLPFWGFYFAHPLNEVLFSAFFGLALPSAPVGSDKNTVSGAALSPGSQRAFRFFEVVPLLLFFLGGAGGGLCVRWRSTRSSSRDSRAKKKKKKKKQKKYKNNKKGKIKTRRSRRRRRRRRRNK